MKAESEDDPTFWELITDLFYCCNGQRTVNHDTISLVNEHSLTHSEQLNPYFSEADAFTILPNIRSSIEDVLVSNNAIIPNLLNMEASMISAFVSAETPIQSILEFSVKSFPSLYDIFSLKKNSLTSSHLKGTFEFFLNQHFDKEIRVERDGHLYNFLTSLTPLMFSFWGGFIQQCIHLNYLSDCYLDIKWITGGSLDIRFLPEIFKNTSGYYRVISVEAFDQNKIRPRLATYLLVPKNDNCFNHFKEFFTIFGQVFEEDIASFTRIKLSQIEQADLRIYDYINMGKKSHDLPLTKPLLEFAEIADKELHMTQSQVIHLSPLDEFLQTYDQSVFSLSKSSNPLTLDEHTVFNVTYDDQNAIMEEELIPNFRAAFINLDSLEMWNGNHINHGEGAHGLERN